MAFEIKVKGDASLQLGLKVATTICEMVRLSRFAISEINTGFPKRKDAKAGVVCVLSVHQVRLRKSKHYCGSHPAECENAGEPTKQLFGGKRLFLEGADWVAWNDLLNDALDSLDIDADIASPICEIRRGRCRRIRYGYHRGSNQNRWDKIGEPKDYADFCGKDSPTTEYPAGTPGEAQWRAMQDVAT